jgi:hypothetical protein
MDFKKGSSKETSISFFYIKIKIIYKKVYINNIMDVEKIENKIVEIIYITYHDSQKRAIKKYLDNNREKINERRRELHKNKMKEDIEYKNNFQNRMKKNYLKKREEIKQNKESI